MSEDVSFVVFTLSRWQYAVPVHRVESIIASTVPTRVPGTYEVRGRIVPILNLRSRLGLEGRPHDGAPGRVLVVSAGGGMVGIEVDQVSEVLSVDQADIHAASQQPDDPLDVAGILHLEGRRVIVADIDALARAQAA